MPWIKFTKPFNYDYRPMKAVCQSYNPGDTPVLVKQEIADAALEGGFAKKASKPKTDD